MSGRLSPSKPRVPKDGQAMAMLPSSEAPGGDRKSVAGVAGEGAGGPERRCAMCDLGLGPTVAGIGVAFAKEASTVLLSLLGGIGGGGGGGALVLATADGITGPGSPTGSSSGSEEASSYTVLARGGGRRRGLEVGPASRHPETASTWLQRRDV